MRWVWAAMVASGCAFNTSGGGSGISAPGDAANMIDAPTPAIDAPYSQHDAPPPIDARAMDARPIDATIDASGSIECAPGQMCGCSSGASCSFRCSGDSCEIICSGNASCSVDCAGATNCNLKCSGSTAACIVQCGGASSCSLTCNPNSSQQCSGNVYVCGRSCP